MRLDTFLRIAVAAALLMVSTFVVALEKRPLQIGITPVLLDNQLSLLRDWGHYLERRLGRPVEFVQRRSYREIVDLTLSGKLDFAWICGYPYVKSAARLRLLAVPVYEGKPEYRSYLIAAADDRTTQSLADLRDRVFAFSDPDSNSGYLVVRYQLWQQESHVEDYFRRTFFAGSHRNVVEAVAEGLADGGAVDGYVWDTLSRVEPQLTTRTRIVEKSQTFGFPPLVAGPDVPATTFNRLQRVLLRMPNDEEGRQLLARMNIDGFSRGKREQFKQIEIMSRAVAAPH